MLFYRWNYYLKMLKDPKSISKIRKQTMYMHDTVFSAVEMSVNDLQIFHREVYDRFLSLVVFNYAHSVPITVLCLYWNLDQEDAEDEMGQICSRSLAIKECSSEGHPVYVVHDIIKSYLSAICADKKQV